jgi:Cadherin-like beta sandwich domain
MRQRSLGLSRPILLVLCALVILMSCTHHTRTQPIMTDSGVGTLDLCKWGQEPANSGSWNVYSGCDGVHQTINGSPSFFFGTDIVPSDRMVTVSLLSSGGDDDYIGFAIGFSAGDWTNPEADFLLIQWNQHAGNSNWQNPRGNFPNGVVGIWLERIKQAGNSYSFGNRPGTIAIGTSGPDSGWLRGVEYVFRLKFSPTLVEVWLKLASQSDSQYTKIIEHADSTPYRRGPLALYNYSQGDVRYGSFKVIPLEDFEGRPVTVGKEFTDAFKCGCSPCTTYGSTIDWGDEYNGVNNVEYVVPNGNNKGSMTSVHAYDKTGLFRAEFCIFAKCNPDARSCVQFEITLSNGAPTLIFNDIVLTTRQDKREGTRDLVLTDAANNVLFRDYGLRQRLGQVATAEWGDNSGTQTLEIGSRTEQNEPTSGIYVQGNLIASHSYPTNSSYNAKFCVTDADQASFCDVIPVLSSERELTAMSTNPAYTIKNFHRHVYDHTLNVENSRSSISLRGVLQNTKSTLKIGPKDGTLVKTSSGSYTQTYSLVVGINSFEYQITALDGKVVTYYLNIDRAPSTNNLLSSVVLSPAPSGYSFVSSTKTYNLAVAYETKTITVTPSVQDNTASMTIEGPGVLKRSISNAAPTTFTLALGANTIVVEVTSQAKTVTRYTYNIEQKRATNANLESISFSPTIGITFKPATTTYTTSVLHEQSTLSVAPIVEHPLASIQSYTINNVVVKVSAGTYSHQLPIVGNNVVKVVVVAHDTAVTKTYTFNINRLKSSNNFLEALSVSPGIGLNFFRDTTSYTLTADNAIASITVSATVEQADASITVNGVTLASGSTSNALSLSVGSNTVTVQVSAQDGTKRTYTLTVNRKPSSDSKLKTLLTNPAYSLNFNPATTTYEFTVQNSVSSISIIPTANEPNAGITVNGVTVASGSPSTAIGLSTEVVNSIEVLVTAQDKITKTNYVLFITREKSSNNKIRTISTSPTSGLSSQFSPDKTTYTLNVANSVSSITFTVTPDDSTATIKVGQNTIVDGKFTTSLDVGSNSVKFDVIAEDLSPNAYTITLIRAPSNNAYLKSMTTSPVNLVSAFNRATLSYTGSVAYSVSGITVLAASEHVAATMTLNGVNLPSNKESALVPLAVYDNKLELVVTAEDGKTKLTYVLNVYRNPSNNANLANIVTSPNLGIDFKTDLTKYTLQADHFTADVFFTLSFEQLGASATINGATVQGGVASQSFPLVVYGNTFTVVVTAQDQSTTRTTTIVINRAPSADTTLRTIRTSPSIGLTFNPSKREYALTVLNTVASLTVSAITVEDVATLTIQGKQQSPSNPIPLSVGNNTVTIQVTAQDQVTVTTTSIYVNRLPSSVSTASSWGTAPITTLNSAFIKSTYTYTVTVVYEYAILTFTAVPSNEFATMQLIHANGTRTSVVSGEEMQVQLAVYDNTVQLVVTAENGKDSSTYTANVYRKPSTDATLSSLSLSPAPSGFKFDSDVFTYAFDVPNSFDLTSFVPVTNNTEPEVAMNVVYDGGDPKVIKSDSTNQWPVHVDLNTIVVEVIAQDRVTKAAYRIQLNRARSVDAYIWNMTSSPDIPDLDKFDPSSLTHTVTVPNSYTSIRLGAWTRHPEATPFVDGARLGQGELSQSLKLLVWNNTFTVAGEAEDRKTTRTYVLTVNREPSVEARISTLRADPPISLQGAFSRDTYTYSLSVPYLIPSIRLIGTLVDSTATFKIGGDPAQESVPSKSLDLVVGANTIIVDTTAEDTVTNRKYTLNIERRKSINPKLQNIVTDPNIPLQFLSNTTKYTVNVVNAIDEIRFKFLFEQHDAVASINSAESIAHDVFSKVIKLTVDENVFSIVTTAQDGKTTTSYDVTIIRARSNDATLSNIVVSPDISLAFDTKQRNYRQVVHNTIDSVSLAVTLNDLTAALQVQGSTVVSGKQVGPFNLVVGTNVITIDVTAEDYVTKQQTTITIERQPSEISSAGSIVTSNPVTAINAAFKPDTLTYSDTLVYASSKFDLKVVPSNDQATIQVKLPSGSTVSAKSGETVPIGIFVYANTIEVIVTAESKFNVTTYVYNVYRKPSTDATLQSISFDPTIDFNFSPDVRSYTLQVGNLYTRTKLRAVATSAEPEVAVTLVVDGKDAGKLERDAEYGWLLHVDDNIVDITVTAQDKKTSITYRVVIQRARSKVVELKSITTNPGIGLQFKPDTRAYDLTVLNTIDAYSLAAVLVDDTANLTVAKQTVSSGENVGPFTLAVGINTVVIEVLAEDQETKQTTTLNVNRLPSPISSAGSWFTSPVTSLNNDFKTDVLSYTVSVSYETPQLNFTATPSNEFATMQLFVGDSDPISLTAGQPQLASFNVYDNTVRLVVTAENKKDVTTYQCGVYRRPSTNPLLQSLSLSPDPGMQFDAKTLSYSFSVANAIDAIDVAAISQQANAQITISDVQKEGSAQYRWPLKV